MGLSALFRKNCFAFHQEVRILFKLAVGRGVAWTRDGGIAQECPPILMRCGLIHETLPHLCDSCREHQRADEFGMFSILQLCVLAHRSELLRKCLFFPFTCVVGSALSRDSWTILVTVLGFSLVSASVEHLREQRGSLFCPSPCLCT